MPGNDQYKELAYTDAIPTEIPHHNEAVLLPSECVLQADKGSSSKDQLISPETIDPTPRKVSFKARPIATFAAEADFRHPSGYIPPPPPVTPTVQTGRTYSVTPFPTKTATPELRVERGIYSRRPGGFLSPVLRETMPAPSEPSLLSLDSSNVNGADCNIKHQESEVARLLFCEEKLTDSA